MFVLQGVIRSVVFKFINRTDMPSLVKRRQSAQQGEIHAKAGRHGAGCAKILLLLLLSCALFLEGTMEAVSRLACVTRLQGQGIAGRR